MFGCEEEVGSVERGRWLGCVGKIFKKVRENIGLVFVCRKRAEGGGLERGRWLGCGGKILRK